VYLCAVVPEVGLSLVDQGLEQMTAEFANGWVKGLSKPDEQGRTVWVDFDFVRKMFYADCDEPTVAAAIDHLRPQAAYPWTLPCSLTEPPSVPCTYVCCTEDRVVNLEWSRRIAHRIGADIVELPGSHSPLLHDRQRWLTSCCVWLKRVSGRELTATVRPAASRRRPYRFELSDADLPVPLLRRSASRFNCRLRPIENTPSLSGRTTTWPLRQVARTPTESNSK
jgi:hypothetical protein